MTSKETRDRVRKELDACDRLRFIIGSLARTYPEKNLRSLKRSQSTPFFVPDAHFSETSSLLEGATPQRTNAARGGKTNRQPLRSQTAWRASAAATVSLPAKSTLPVTNHQPQVRWSGDIRGTSHTRPGQQSRKDVGGVDFMIHRT